MLTSYHCDLLLEVWEKATAFARDYEPGEEAPTVETLAKIPAFMEVVKAANNAKQEGVEVDRLQDTLDNHLPPEVSQAITLRR